MAPPPPNLTADVDAQHGDESIPGPISVFEGELPAYYESMRRETFTTSHAKALARQVGVKFESRLPFI